MHKMKDEHGRGRTVHMAAGERAHVGMREEELGRAKEPDRAVAVRASLPLLRVDRPWQPS